MIAHRPAARLLTALAALAGTGCVSGGGGGVQDEVRVLVYNIHAGKDADGVRNLERIARLVRATRADVSLLQEVDRGTERSGGEDHPVVLSELTGREAVFGRTLDYQGGEYGIGLLSRWPITEHSVRPLTIDPPQERAGGSYEPRGALIASIEAPLGDIRVINTHLDASGDDGYRRQEIARVLALADSLTSSGGGMVLIGGDLNADPDSEVIRTLLDAGWRDAWVECGVGDGNTFPAAEPIKRIDYVFVPRGWSCVSAEVIATETSDHRPLLVIFAGGPGRPAR